jgi:yecA family protein
MGLGRGTDRRVTGASPTGQARGLKAYGGAFTYDELDVLLRGAGRDGLVGLSAIDGLIAALVAGPSFVHPDEWVPLLFAGRRPALDAHSLEFRIVKTVFNRYNEVSDILAERPRAYRPIFMIDDEGKTVVDHWVVGFMLGLRLRSVEWANHVLLTKHRALLTPILVYSDATTDLLPEMSEPEKRRHHVTAYQQIAGAVAAVRAICSAHRTAEANRTPPEPRRSTGRRR